MTRRELLLRVVANGQLPPGYQHWLNEGRQGSHGEPLVTYGNHDGAPSPAGKGPFKRARRRPGVKAGTPEQPYYGPPRQRN